MKNMPPIKPRRPYYPDHPKCGSMESDNDYVKNNIEAAVWLLDVMQKPLKDGAPQGYRELEFHQWCGLARDIIMCLDMNCRRGDHIHEHLDSIGTPIPDWLTEYIPNAPHCPSKGNIVCAIVRAALTAQPD